jgi:putative transcriptional regulator
MRYLFFLLPAALLLAQSKNPGDLAPGKFLITTSPAPDPIFAESVILLIRYGADGAFGLMINRPSGIPIARALHELRGAGGHNEPVFFGGPVQLDAVFALSRAPAKPEGATEVFGRLYLLAAKPALEKSLAHARSSDVRMYLGYCGWSPHQLENEVTRGGWYILTGDEALVFDGDPETLWRRLIRKAESQLARARITAPAAR